MGRAHARGTPASAWQGTQSGGSAGRWRTDAVGCRHFGQPFPKGDTFESAYLPAWGKRRETAALLASLPPGANPRAMRTVEIRPPSEEDSVESDDESELLIEVVAEAVAIGMKKK